MGFALLGRRGMRWLGSRHHSGVGDFFRAHGTHCTGRHGYDRDGFAGKGDKFDLVTGAAGVNHYNPADIARLQTLSRQAFRQNHRV
jgi:hypothetical protein